MIGAPLAAPIVEEATKGLGMLLLFWLARSEFDNVRDGFVYGALIGAGFNWFESALYVQQNFVQFGDAPFGFQLGMRYAWFGLAGHAMFSGIFGASLGSCAGDATTLAGLARAGRRVCAGRARPRLEQLASALPRARRRQGGEAPPTEVAPPPDMGLLQAMASASLSNLFIFLPFALLMVWIIRRSGHAERAVIREELADEVGRFITPEEYQAVLTDRVYRTRRIDTQQPRRLGGARRRPARARVSQAPPARPGARPRSRSARRRTTPADHAIAPAAQRNRRRLS